MHLMDTPALPHASDRGTLLVVGALFFVSILAHRLWRGKIRAEDECEALKKDQAFSQGRYRAGFRGMAGAAAFVDRATGLVIEGTPGWRDAGLPEAGKALWQDDAAAEAAWKAIPAPAADGTPAAPTEVSLGGQSLRALPLGGDSLGVVLVERR